jgi:hypothetical protein
MNYRNKKLINKLYGMNKAREIAVARKVIKIFSKPKPNEEII